MLFLREFSLHVDCSLHLPAVLSLCCTLDQPLSTSDSFSLSPVFVTDQGKVLTCGKSSSGQLGHGGTKGYLIAFWKIGTCLIINMLCATAGTGATKLQRLPTQVMSLAHVPIMQVACGSSHSIFVSYEVGKIVLLKRNLSSAVNILIFVHVQIS